jgi:hypothetical protein
MLSHSSKNNLTKHWANTIALEPEGTDCYPCHLMQYSFEHCHKDEATGTAKCQKNISLDAAWAAFEQHI